MKPENYTKPDRNLGSPKDKDHGTVKSNSLELYRKKASFDLNAMQCLLIGEDVLKIQTSIWRTLESDPLFSRTPGQILSFEDKRRLAALRYKKFEKYKFVSEEEFLEKPMSLVWSFLALGMYDWSVALKKTLGTDSMLNFIASSGTGYHAEQMNDFINVKNIGCICMTELSHGSNTKNLRTTATFDPKSQKFFINTPDFEATKVWIGNLGKTATHAVLFAQLITPDGVNQGLHSFLTPIRDPATLLPFPGVVVGDLGPKLGLNGLDNGFVAFHNYAIEKECLLSHTGKVTSEGKYVTPFKNPSKRLGASLGSLSLARFVIIGISLSNLLKALTIAVRYSTLRRQFGPSDDDEELPIIEYQLQQWKLIPFLASGYCIYIFLSHMKDEYIKFRLGLFMRDKSDKQLDFGAELHALSCGGKALSSWTARDGIQQCREACGGHGYLQVSGFGDLRNDNDANCTYEGDNNVLLQQTSNFLLNYFNSKKSGEKISSPLHSVAFINDLDSILCQTMPRINSFQMSRKDVVADFILNSYKFLTSYLLRTSSMKIEKELSQGKDTFTARNDTQVYFLRHLALAFTEYAVMMKSYEFIFNASIEKSLGDVLQNLFLLHGLHSLEKHLSTFYQAGYASGPELANYVKEGILKLCFALKDDAVTLCDVFAPPDFILNSALGCSDGQLYKNLYGAILQTPNAFERPTWWKEFVMDANAEFLKPKL